MQGRRRWGGTAGQDNYVKHRGNSQKIIVIRFHKKKKKKKKNQNPNEIKLKKNTKNHIYFIKTQKNKEHEDTEEHST
jgi:hypothetical protein